MKNFTPIVSIVNSEPLASTEVIAHGMRQQHASVIKLVRKHADTLSQFGPIRFEIRLAGTRQGGGRPVEYSMLNERQAALLLTLMRNSDEVIGFKAGLISEFYRMRDALSQRDQNLWQQMQSLIAKEVESKVRASFGSHLMLERKREIPYFTSERERLESEIQPSLLN